MVLSKIILLVLLDFLAAATVFGWSHVSRNQFETIVNENEVALVACKSHKQVLMSTAVSWLMKSRLPNIVKI